MTQFDPDTPLSRADSERRSVWSSGVGFVSRHPMGVAQACGVALLVIVVLQNVEPVDIDLLFWSVARVPKLVLILASMLAGGVLWELLRRRLRA